MRKFISGAAVAGALLIGPACSTPEQASSPVIETTAAPDITAQQKTFLRTVFNQTVDYWQSEGVQKMAPALVLGADRATASYNEEANTLLVGNAIIAEAAQYSPTTEQAIAMMVIAHELGHWKQAADGLDLHTQYLKERAANELQAYCLAGVAMQALYADRVDEAATYLRTWDNDPDRRGDLGLTERGAYFQQGARTGDC